MTLVKFNNGQKNAVNPWFNDVFDSLISDSFLYDRFINKVPAVNIAETENEFHIELAAPGLKKDDFKISLDKNVLSISAENKVENTAEGKKYSKREFSYNSFVRSFTLPESADQAKIDAGYTDGVLKLRVGKKEEAKFQSRDIAVQ
jgi:HSP20 family protein